MWSVFMSGLDDDESDEFQFILISLFDVDLINVTDYF